MCEMTNQIERPRIVASGFGSAFEDIARMALGRPGKDLPELLRAVVSAVGVKHIAYLRFSNDRSVDITLLNAFVTYSKDWQTRYFLKRYHAIDPVILYGAAAKEPFDWRDAADSAPRTLAFLADAIHYGVGQNGLTIPVRSRRNGFGLVSLSCDLERQDWEELKSAYLPKWQILSVLIDSAANINTRLHASEIKLSKREEECLIWAARGKTYNETAEIMSIGYGSVKTHLDGARHKLDCINVTHSAALAVAIGLIPPQALKGTDPKGFAEDGADEFCRARSVNPRPSSGTAGDPKWQPLKSSPHFAKSAIMSKRRSQLTGPK